MSVIERQRIAEVSEWMKNEAGRCIQECRVAADDETVLFMPGNKNYTGYRAIWTRDFSYMLQYAPEMFDMSEVKAALQYILSRQREDGAIPDYVDASGVPKYPVFGSDPATDNPSFLVQAVDVYLRRSNDLSTIQGWIPALTAGLQSIPRNRGTGMVWIDPLRPHCSYGFTDTIGKTGDELFCSLLFIDASKKMYQWWEDYRLGEELQAQLHLDNARYITDHLHEFWDEETNLFNAATYHCNQNDIWGSAFACAESLAPEQYIDKIAASLCDKKESFVLRGQIRHLPTPLVWETLQSRSKDYRDGKGGKSTRFVLNDITPGVYQNGGYWATPLLWVYKAVAKIDREMASSIVLDAIEDFRSNGIWEWVNEGAHAERDYVASATAAYASLKALQDSTLDVDRAKA